jgi:hypothetical protein
MPVKGEGKIMGRPLLALITVCFPAVVLAQSPAPSKPRAQAKPKEPISCKFVGTVKGTKLWAGDCVADEPRGGELAETRSLSEQAIGAIPPDPKH